MLFRRLSILAGLMALTLGNPPVLAQSSHQNSDFLASAPMFMAQGGPGGRMGGNGEMGSPGGRMLERLNLTEAQKQQIQTIRDGYQARMQSLQEQLRTQQDELRNLMTGNASDSEIRAKHDQVLATRQELGNLHFESMLEIRGVLTESQRAEMAQMMEQHRGQRRGNRGGGNNDDNNPQGQERGNRGNRNNGGNNPQGQGRGNRGGGNNNQSQ